MKGISPLISTVLVVLFISTASVLVITIAIPTINRAKETTVINEAGINIRTLDAAIKEVASEGIGSFRAIQLKVSDGNYRIFNYSGNNTGAVEYKLGAKYNTLPLFSILKEGNIKYSTGVSTRGLVGYWKFNEGSGSNVTDSSGNGNTGTLNTNVTWTSAGKFGNAVSFNRSVNYVSVVNNPSLNPSNGITVMAWVYPVQAVAGQNIVEKGANSQYRLRYDPNNFWFVYSNGSSYEIISSNTNLPLSTWSHVAVTFDGSGKISKIYYNGNLVNSLNSNFTSLGTTTDQLTMGGESFNEYFNGTIDEVRIWNRALTAEEIKADFDPKQSDYQVVLQYDKIYLQGTDRFGKGSHKVCIEKMGTEVNKTVVKISKCG
jgi:hypothetical protein